MLSSSIQNNVIDKKAATVTLIVHAILLLLFVFIQYTLPPTTSPTEELGMEVNLGNSDDGFGTMQAHSMHVAANQLHTSNSSSAQHPNIQSDNQISTNESAHPDDVAVRSLSTKKTDSKTSDNSKNNTNKTTQQPKAIFTNQSNVSGNQSNKDQTGGSEGIGKGNGDMGVPGGTEGSSNYTGTPGNGNGIGHSFNDRDMIARPETNAEFKNGGKVVIHVTVNREGNIINKRILKSSNAELTKIALEKVQKVKFSKSESAPPEQFGNITFVFKTKGKK